MNFYVVEIFYSVSEVVDNGYDLCVVLVNGYCDEVGWFNLVMGRIEGDLVCGG